MRIGAVYSSPLLMLMNVGRMSDVVGMDLKPCGSAPCSEGTRHERMVSLHSTLVPLRSSVGCGSFGTLDSFMSAQAYISTYENHTTIYPFLRAIRPTEEKLGAPALVVKNSLKM